MAETLEKPTAGRMSVDAFIRLVQTLPPERISGIAVEQLPENVPSNIAQHLPIASRNAVEGLLLAANSFHLSRRMKDEEVYGQAVVSAMDRAKVSGDTANIRVFKDKILNMINMLQDQQRNKKKYTVNLFIKNIAHINDLLIDVRSEIVSINRSIEVLEQVEAQTEADRARFGEAIGQLTAQADAIDKLLGEYYVFRLKIMSRAIGTKRHAVEDEEKKNAHIPERVAELRKELEEARSFWNRTLNRRKANDQAQEIQKQISELIHELKQNEVMISEEDLTLWLDAIVDASINTYAKMRISGPARDARISLYFLLNTYCRKQEESAFQIAQNPFMHVEPEKAIRYVLLSEQFILDYFANKKKDTTAWLSGAAKSKIEELDQLERDILSELRRSNKISVTKR